jgi:hypothetical protein
MPPRTLVSLLAGLLSLAALPLITPLRAQAPADPATQAAPEPPPAATAPPAAAPSRPTAAVPDFVTARIKYLHDRLRITPEQETLWEPVAQAMRDDAREIFPLLRERFRATAGGAPDLLRAYEKLDALQLDSIRKFTAAFDPLYAALPENQKKIADVMLREGAQNTSAGIIPGIPAPFVAPVVAPSLYTPFGYYRPFVHHFGFHHFGGPRR